MKDITHIERSNLPWHSERVTECGLDATRHPTWTRDEAIAKAREMGRQRFSLFACMTCTSTAERHATWESSPASCMARYTEKARWNRGDEGAPFDAELRAIALLIEEHRAEFDETVAGLLSAGDLAAKRSVRRLRERGLG